jgi:hypothetical protein
MHILRSILTAGFVLITAVGPAQKQDMQEYLEKSRQMMAEGDPAEALKRFQWFHDNALKHDSGMTGVRLSFALGYWRELADKYEPARVALEDLRADTYRQVLKKNPKYPGGWGAFHDLTSLDSTLDSTTMTVAAFEHWLGKDPESAKSAWRICKNAVIHHKRLDLIKRLLPHPSEEFRETKMMHDQLIDPSMSFLMSKSMRDMMKEEARKTFIADTVMLVEISLAQGDRAGAEKIVKEALTIHDSVQIRRAIEYFDPAKYGLSPTTSAQGTTQSANQNTTATP